MYVCSSLGVEAAGGTSAAGGMDVPTQNPVLEGGKSVVLGISTQVEKAAGVMFHAPRFIFGISFLPFYSARSRGAVK